MSDTPDYIMAFMKAVYGDYADIALELFDEKMAMEAATEKIRRLEEKLAMEEIR